MFVEEGLARHNPLFKGHIHKDKKDKRKKKWEVEDE